jgi:hypothetical protein
MKVEIPQGNPESLMYDDATYNIIAEKYREITEFYHPSMTNNKTMGGYPPLKAIFQKMAIPKKDTAPMFILEKCIQNLKNESIYSYELHM